jgi:actin-related protein
VTRSDVAGRDVTRQLQLQLRRAGLSFTTTAEADLASPSRSEICYMTTQAADEGGKGGQDSIANPDGQVVTVASERFQAPNVLFDPS